MSSNIHISLVAETIFHIGPIGINNSMLVTFLVTASLLLFAKASLKKGRIRDFAEAIIDGLLGFFESIVGENAQEFFPLVATFLLFILLGNWSGLLPGVGTIGLWVHEHGEEVFVPLLRGSTADLNTTLALAIVSVVSIHFFALKHLGRDKYIVSRFINPIGILELMADVAKVLSFAFRLFGNIFAGEVLLTVIAFLMPIIAPLPFMGLELFVGLVQSLVFSLLTLIFLNTAIESH
jgi:F-type H+-transporting ATPase subunit a